MCIRDSATAAAEALDLSERSASLLPSKGPLNYVREWRVYGIHRRPHGSRPRGAARALSHLAHGSPRMLTR
eukprot:7724011-Pyramimonas_sp.AAC.1